MSATGSTPAIGSSTRELADHASGGDYAPGLSDWESWFLAATDSQRAEALAMAGDRGVLDFRRLPAPANGVHVKPPAKLVRTFLPEVLAGGHVDFAPFAVAEPTFGFVSDLTPLERDAIARAVASPDLFAIGADDRRQTCRLAIEIAGQLCRTGQRTLLVGPDGCLLDDVLAGLSQTQEVFPLRLADWHRVNANGCVDAERCQLKNRLVGHAAHSKTSAEAARARLEEEAKVGSVALTLAAEYRTLQSQIEVLDRKAAEISSSVRQELERFVEGAAEPPGGPGDWLRNLQIAENGADKSATNGHASDRAGDAAAQRELEEVRATIAELEPKVQAVAAGQILSFKYWSGLAGNVRTRFAEAQAKEAELVARLAQIETECRAQRESVRRDERNRAVEQEVARRRGLLEEDRRSLSTRVSEIRQQWSILAAENPALQLGQAPDCLVDPVAASQAWSRRRASVGASQAFAARWSEFVEKNADLVVEHAGRFANPVAVAADSLNVLDQAGHAAFDVALVLGADVIDAECWNSVATRARRFVLVGASLNAGLACAGVSREWRNVWRLLGGDLAVLDYQWSKVGDRIRCDLSRLSESDLQYVETETLCDADDVEIQILDAPGAPPRLASVVFPGRFSFAEAVEFVHRELQELPVSPSARVGLWQENGEMLTYETGGGESAGHRVEFTPGVWVEWIGDGEGSPWSAVRVVFQKANGWTRAGAERLLASTSAWRDTGRSVLLSAGGDLPLAAGDSSRNGVEPHGDMADLDCRDRSAAGAH